MPASEITDVVREDTCIHGAEVETPRVEPSGEGAQIGSIRALGRLGQTTVLEEAVDRGGGHARRIRRAACAAFRRERLQVRAAPFNAALPAGVSLTVELVKSPPRAISMSPSASASSHVESRGQCVFHASMASGYVRGRCEIQAKSSSWDVFTTQ